MGPRRAGEHYCNDRFDFIQREAAMGSGLVRDGQRIPQDLEGIRINPGSDNSNGDRQSTVDVAANVTVPGAVDLRIAVLIEEPQSVTTFSIKQAHGGYEPDETTTDTDRTALKAWHHTSPNQKWVAFDVLTDYVPASFPWVTKFKLSPKHTEPQDVLWVAVLKSEGFGFHHRLFGWTQYPKPSPNGRSRRGPAPAKKPARPKPARRTKRRR